MQQDFNQIKQRFGIIGTSPLLARAIGVAVQVAPTDMSVLIIGESGVGKEVFPKIIHQHSQRKHNAYIAVNCGAIPEGTIDSELFGHLKGSFTGAMSDRKGYFQEANGGTIFLDEVGELPLSTQARLLRVLETGEYIPVGASQPQKTDVRIVAATNVNMQDAVARGRFREDLLFRLNTVPIEIPPLRRRKEDVGLLFRYFASQAAERYNMPPLRLQADALQMLEQYAWPGNIRELRNLTERISILEEERMVSAEAIERHLPQAVHVDYRPALRPASKEPQSESEGYTSGEREAILQLILEMRKELSELRTLVGRIMSGEVSVPQHYVGAASLPTEVLSSTRPPYPPALGHSLGAETTHKLVPLAEHHRAVDEVEVQIVDYQRGEDVRSLEEMERDMIIAALSRHAGRRRATAEELKISERTLYRKIKEYGIES